MSKGTVQIGDQDVWLDRFTNYTGSMHHSQLQDDVKPNPPALECIVPPIRLAMHCASHQASYACIVPHIRLAKHCASHHFSLASSNPYMVKRTSGI